MKKGMKNRENGTIKTWKNWKEAIVYYWLIIFIDFAI